METSERPVHVSIQLPAVRFIFTGYLVAPFSKLALSRLVSLPTPSLKVGPDPHLIRLGPLGGLNAKYMFQNFSDRYVGQGSGTLYLFIVPVVIARVTAVHSAALKNQPAIDKRIPRIGLVALILLDLDQCNQIRLVEPPDRSLPIAENGFGPELFTVAAKSIDIDRTAAHGPEAAIAGFVAQIGVWIYAAGEYALSGHLDHISLVRRTVAVGRSGQKGLDPGYFGPTDGIKLGYFDNPFAAHLLRGILATDFGKFVGKPLRTGESFQGAGLFRTLRTLKNQHVVDFRAWLHDAGHRRDHPAGPDGAIEGRILSAYVCEQPPVKPRFVIPDEALQVIAHRMHAYLARNNVDATADYGRPNIDVAVLQPFGATHIVRIAPWTRQDTVLVPWQGSRDQNLLAKLIEHQRSGKGLVVGECGDDVRLVALGRADKVEPQLARPARPYRPVVDITRGMQALTQSGDLPIQNGDRDTCGGLDRRQHLALGQGLQPGHDELPEQAAEDREIGRVGQGAGGGLEL